MMAVLDIDGLKVRVNDTPIQHDFTFTPSMSMFFETTEPAAYSVARSLDCPRTGRCGWRIATTTDSRSASPGSMTGSG